ncbi:Heterogeneous nuclear ribonucleoprotein L [Toxocara canis]|uniref:Heterogeneous nuclear ribonucleoprotein L n=1 Tax=Toxocara canis TaxID=6265 RepID=A0A0B2VR02_TOXCA|nr:Heterogeneous nuclear ribonucleoprotein L [Toxocara canis]
MLSESFPEETRKPPLLNDNGPAPRCRRGGYGRGRGAPGGGGYGGGYMGGREDRYGEGGYGRGGGGSGGHKDYDDGYGDERPADTVEKKAVTAEEVEAMAEGKGVMAGVKVDMAEVKALMAEEKADTAEAKEVMVEAEVTTAEDKIKFMKSKPDTCMAQMGNVREVYTTIENLHGTTIFGQKIALRPSKQQVLHEIRDPFTLPDGTPSFRDYVGSRNQRYTTPELAARNRIVKPTNVLHWFNAPVTMTEDKLKELFADGGAATPKSVTVFPQRSERSSSGICEFESTEQAVEAILLANHTPVKSPVGKVPYIVKLAFAAGRDEKVSVYRERWMGDSTNHVV